PSMAGICSQATMLLQAGTDQQGRAAESRRKTMTSHAGALSTDRRRRRVAIAGGMTLILAMLAGLGTCQIGLHGHAAPRSASVPRQTHLTAASSEAIETELPVSSVRGSRARSSESPQLVLVGSAEQALETNRGIEAANV